MKLEYLQSCVLVYKMQSLSMTIVNHVAYGLGSNMHYSPPLFHYNLDEIWYKGR